MQYEIVKLLNDNFPERELFIDSYYSSCNCYVISREGNCYIINHETIFDFIIACVAFIKKSDNEICMIVTNKKYRGKGYATDMLTYLNEVYPKTSLWVRTTNHAAIYLYQNKMGYEVDEVRENFYDYTGINCDGLHMTKINK